MSGSEMDESSGLPKSMSLADALDMEVTPGEAAGVINYLADQVGFWGGPYHEVGRKFREHATALIDAGNWEGGSFERRDLQDPSKPNMQTMQTAPGAVGQAQPYESIGTTLPPSRAQATQAPLSEDERRELTRLRSQLGQVMNDPERRSNLSSFSTTPGGSPISPQDDTTPPPMDIPSPQQSATPTSPPPGTPPPPPSGDPQKSKLGDLSDQSVRADLRNQGYYVGQNDDGSYYAEKPDDPQAERVTQPAPNQASAMEPMRSSLSQSMTEPRPNQDRPTEPQTPPVTGLAESPDRTREQSPRPMSDRETYWDANLQVWRYADNQQIAPGPFRGNQPPNQPPVGTF